jgi:RNA polymerase sigma-70 factor, ECF subfamily
VVDRYVTAFRNADVDGLKRLLADDVILEMPPFLNWYAGPDRYAGFIARVFRLRGTDWRLLPVSAGGQPALAAYVAGPGGRHLMHTLQVFCIRGDRVRRTVVFGDPAVFALFGLAPAL